VFARVLIANRGEIAVRVARTLHRLGIEAVAVFSDADAAAPHVRAADHAVRLGPAAAAESYLHVERVIEAALRTGAEAVHPGYGFLAERPDFARACASAGLTFIGPGPEAMALLGDKVTAKAAAVAAGLPVLPGLSGDRLSDAEILAWAAGQKLPLLLKAAAGGGGKGMRIVRTHAELPEALGAARREARAAFGDDRLFVERYVERSRHLEVQLIADTHGTVLHLGERECSLQRRHQKVIEEAPSPVVDAALRERLGAAAVALARSCGYVNAGTVELIADRDSPGAFFFLEVNARLQVEHAVTEAVTGLDLVELQLRVAAGEPLRLTQEAVALNGHAVEARIYAEDPEHGFLPSTGRITGYHEPAGLRVDSGVSEGVEVESHYDPLLLKVIAHAADRDAALEQLDRGLGELRVLGPATNGAYLRALLARPEVREGRLDTALIERLGPEIAPPALDPALPAVALAVLTGEPASDGSASDDPWQARDGWRLVGSAWTRARLAGPGGEIAVELRRAPGGGWAWHSGVAGGLFRLGPAGLEVDGVLRPLGVHRDGDVVWLLDGACVPARFARVSEEQQARKAAGAGSLQAPMPGTVIDVRVAAGAEVEEGEVLVVIESMKMELAVLSPGGGVVAGVLVALGDRVARGQALVTLAAANEKVVA
jgi:acetyl-CoA/propionyl-CoA carboxylase biotin carboxyl carrier protein